MAPADPSTSATSAAANRAVVDAARDVVLMLEERIAANEVLTQDFVERYCTASCRLADARTTVATSDDDRRAAIEEHLDRLQRFRASLEGLRDGSPSRFVQVDYFIAVARARVAR